MVNRMDDLISRQALMKEFSDFVRASNSSDFARTPTWNDAVSLVGSMPSAQQWIPCKDRLPAHSRKTYWVCTNEDGQYACRWTNNRFGLGDSDNWGWSIFDIPQYSEVVAWMPLPEPYKGGE